MAGTSDRIVYSWDTNVFLAHLKAEADKPLADINAVADEIERGLADCVLSVIVISEMVDLIDDAQLAVVFHEFIERPNVLKVDVYPRLARRAAVLRAAWRRSSENSSEAKPPNVCQACGKSLGENRNIKTPDAIVLVTAMLHGATVLHSFEPAMKRHNKTPLVNGLEISDARLYSGQMILPERTDAQPRAETTNDHSKSSPIPDREDESLAADTGASPVGGTEYASTEETGAGGAEG